MAEDFNKLRMLARQLGTTDFKQSWQFRLEIQKAPVFPPDDFDFYVRDITYDPVIVSTENEKIGGHQFVWPTGLETVTISMTMRDHADCRIYRWFSALILNIVSQSGLLYMKDDYSLQIVRYALQTDGSESPIDTWECFPTKMGEMTESRAEAGHLEFPITFAQITTLNPIDWSQM